MQLRPLAYIARLRERDGAANGKPVNETALHRKFRLGKTERGIVPDKDCPFTHVIVTIWTCNGTVENFVNEARLGEWKPRPSERLRPFRTDRLARNTASA